jgi:hypothetical protein
MKTISSACLAILSVLVVGAASTTWAEETKSAPPAQAPVTPPPDSNAAAKAAAPAAGDAAKEVPFPKGYRTWTHVKSMVINSKKNPLFDAFGGIHHVYANKKALAALREGKHEFPEGSAFVFDLLDIKNKTGAYLEGKRKFVATIYRDGQKYADTEGWGWQAWQNGDPSKPVLKTLDDQKVCATCHRNEAADKGFVFTEWRR